MKKFISIITLTIFILGCGIYNNPADPNAPDYQGYETVSSVKYITIVKEEYYGDEYKITVNNVDNATTYGFKLVRESNSEVYYEDETSTINSFIIDYSVLPYDTYELYVKVYTDSWSDWVRAYYNGIYSYGVNYYGQVDDTPYFNSIDYGFKEVTLSWNNISDWELFDHWEISIYKGDEKIEWDGELDPDSTEISGLENGVEYKFSLKTIDISNRSSTVYTVFATPNDYRGLTVINSNYYNVNDFKIGEYEVTYDLWYEVYTWALENGYTFINEGQEGSNGVEGAEPASFIEPVINISWADAVIWCNAYSEKSEKKSVYTDNIGNILRDATNSDLLTLLKSYDANGGYRLPLLKEVYYLNSVNYYTINNINNYSWNKTNSDLVIHKAGEKTESNNVYDLLGNVKEWCYDWVPEDYTNESVITQIEYPDTGSNKFLFGGCYSSYIDPNVQDTIVDIRTPLSADITYGFRIAMSITE